MVIDRREFFKSKWALTFKGLRARKQHAEIFRRLKVLPTELHAPIMKESLGQ